MPNVFFSQLLDRPIEGYVPPDAVRDENGQYERRWTNEEIRELVLSFKREMEPMMLEQLPTMMRKIMQEVTLTTLGAWFQEMLRSRAYGLAVTGVPSAGLQLPPGPVPSTTPGGALLIHGLRHLLQRQDAAFRSPEQERACYLVAQRRAQCCVSSPPVTLARAWHMSSPSSLPMAARAASSLVSPF